MASQFLRDVGAEAAAIAAILGCLLLVGSVAQKWWRVIDRFFDWIQARRVAALVRSVLPVIEEAVAEIANGAVGAAVEHAVSATIAPQIAGVHRRIDEHMAVEESDRVQQGAVLAELAAAVETLVGRFDAAEAERSADRTEVWAVISEMRPDLDRRKDT